MIFSHKIFYPLGLDISEKFLKLVQLKSQSDSLGIQALSWVELPSGTIHNGDLENEHNFLVALENLLRQPQFGKIKGNEIIASLPEQKAFIKLLEINKSPNELPEVIETEISKHIPLSIGDMYYDWQIIENNVDGQLVLAAAASSSTVNRHSDILNQAGLFVEAMEPEPISLCRSLLAEESSKYQGVYDKNYIILNFGEASVSLTFYSKNTILFSTSLPVYEDSKKMSSQEIADDLKDKIKDLERYYENHYPDRGEINALFVCGFGAIKEVEEILKKYFSFHVGLGDVFINFSEAKEDFNKIFEKNKNKSLSSLSFAAAIGAALRGIMKK